MVNENVVILHVLPNRLRLRMDALKGDPEKGRELEKTLQRYPSVARARVNGFTGTIMVDFELMDEESLLAVVAELFPSIDVGELEQRMAVAQEELRSAARHRQQTLQGKHSWAGRVRSVSSALNDRVGGATGGADLRVLVPAAFVLLGSYRAATSSLKAPSWYELLWFGFNTFTNLNIRGAQDDDRDR